MDVYVRICLIMLAIYLEPDGFYFHYVSINQRHSEAAANPLSVVILHSKHKITINNTGL